MGYICNRRTRGSLLRPLDQERNPLKGRKGFETKLEGGIPQTFEVVGKQLHGHNQGNFRGKTQIEFASGPQRGGREKNRGTVSQTTVREPNHGGGTPHETIQKMFKFPYRKNRTWGRPGPSCAGERASKKEQSLYRGYPRGDKQWENG